MPVVIYRTTVTFTRARDPVTESAPLRPQDAVDEHNVLNNIPVLSCAYLMLHLDVTKMELNYLLSACAMPRQMISQITGSSTGNIGRDVWAYKEGKRVIKEEHDKYRRLKQIIDSHKISD